MAQKPKYRNDSPGVVVWEEYVGQAPDVICYPGVSSCITITCVSPSALSGTHLTVGSDPGLISAAIASLATAGSASFAAVYVVGKIDLFKQSTRDSGFNTRKKIASTLRKAFSYTRGQVFFYDTAPHAAGVNIGVVRGTAAAAFSWLNEKTSPVKGFTVPDLSTYTPIPPGAFLSR